MPIEQFFKTATGQPTNVDDDQNPLPVTIAGGSSGTDITEIGGTAVPGSGATVALPVGNASGVFSVTNPEPVSQTVAGAAVSAANPEPVTGAVQELVTSVDFTTTNTATGAGTQTVIAAPGTNLYNVVTDITLSWDTLGGATTFTVTIGSTTVWAVRMPVTAGSISVSFTTPKSHPATANEAVTVTITAPITGTVYWTVGGTVVG